MTGFEVTIQIQESALERVLRAQHTRGIMSHKRAVMDGRRQASLQLGRPSLSLIPSSGPTAELAATIDFQALFTDFAVDARSSINSEVLTITVHTSTQVENGLNPTPYLPGLGLSLNWVAQSGDITTSSGAPPSADTVLETLRMIGSWQDAFPIPEIRGSASLPGISSISHRVLESPVTGEPLLVVGLNTEGNVGTPDELADSSVTSDWAVKLSAAFVLSVVERTLRQKYPDLPPPHGAGVISFDEGVVDRLDFTFADGHIHFEGRVSASHATADFRFNAVLELLGNEIVVSLRDFEVTNIDLDFVASFLNLITTGDVAEKVREAVLAGLKSENVGAGFSDFFSEDLLSKFASGGPFAALQIAPELSRLDTLADGILLHGRLRVPQQSAAPVAKFSMVTRLPFVPEGQVTTTRTDLGRPNVMRTGTSGSGTLADSRKGLFGSGVKKGLSSPDRSTSPSSGATPESVQQSSPGRTSVEFRDGAFRTARGNPTVRTHSIPRQSGPSTRIDLGLQNQITASFKPPAGSPELNPGPPNRLVLLDGTASWAPGGDLVSYRWDFGNGETETTSGPRTRAVTRHAFSSGYHVVSLTVTDASGGTKTVGLPLVLGQLTLEHLVHDSPAWQACRGEGSISLEFIVKEEGVRVKDATVTVAGLGWSAQGETDANGIATISVDLQQNPPNPPEITSPFAVGKLTVTASKMGFMETSHLVWIYNCDVESFDPTKRPTRPDDLHRELVALIGNEKTVGPRGQMGTPQLDGRPDRVVETLRLSRAIQIVAELQLLARSATKYSAVTSGAKKPSLWQTHVADDSKAVNIAEEARSVLERLGMKSLI